MKKVLILVITLAMIASLGVAVMAEEPANPVLPGDDDFSTVIALEKAQGDTSQGLPEKALIENDCADKRLEALGDAKDQIGEEEFGKKVLAELIKYLEKGEENLGLIIADMARDKDNSENAQVADDVAKGIKERGWRLEEIVGDENMPEGAQEGAKKALKNMERAAEKAAWARGEREDGPPGPPPWAGKNEVENDAKDMEIEVKPKVEETPAEDFLPEEKPVEEPPPVEAPPVEVPEGEDNDEKGPPEGVPANGAPAEKPAPAGGPPER